MNDTIFIFGMTQRVGTNYLIKMLWEHAECVKCPPIWEDYLVCPSKHLVNYVLDVDSKWGAPWKNKRPFKEELLKSLGDGLCLFLRKRAGTQNSRLLTKTPSISGLEYFQYLFPGAKCVILIRDGRNVTASMIKGFNHSFEEAIRIWVNAAIHLIDLENTIPNFTANHLIIRYEDLSENTSEILKQIFNHFSLDFSNFNFDKAAATPIIGSSFFRGGKEKVHWQPVEMIEEFKTICRWEDWDKKQHRKFKDIAGETMNQLGYSCEY